MALRSIPPIEPDDVPARSPRSASGTQRIGGRSWQSKVLFVIAKTFVRPVLTVAPINPFTMRFFPLLELAASRLLPKDDRVLITKVRADGFKGELTTATQDWPESGGAILYMHGGGFVACGPGTHRRLTSSLSRRTGLPVLSVDYRQLPETGIPGSIADCIAAYQWLLDRGHKPESIVFAGDSAGGYLSFAVALEARKAGLPMPSGLAVCSPLVDLDNSVRTEHVNYKRDAYIPVRKLDNLTPLFFHPEPLDLLAAPIHGELAGLPPVLIQVSGSEVLRADAEAMAEKLAAAGVPCILQIWQGVVHAFTAVGLTPEARRASADIAAFVTSRQAA
ncbi:alpha/beta hydrolase [Pseudonocardiaceae bacterium YIM PH 21723]|nr:alpha/beta hydrolase [Pseudonocardiaceae bacterium YIM PH 21723]